MLEPRLLLSAMLSTLAGFSGTSISGPEGDVAIDANGDVFGTSASGGSANPAAGTVWELAAGATTPTVLASFDASNGEQPAGGVTLVKGDLLGTTSNGGENSTHTFSEDGTVFEIVPGSNSVTTLAVFDGTDGSSPDGGITADANGDLFGTTSQGGSNSDGTVWELAPDTSNVTTIASFSGSNGATPAGDLAIDAHGNLFGTTFAGGDSNGDGTVFEVAAGTDAITTLASFDGNNGSGPTGVTLDASGNLFGTTESGGSGSGTVFEVALGSFAITTLGSFNGNNGSQPQAGVTLDAHGDILGTTFSGGASNSGTAFEIPVGSATITTLVSFSGGADGTSPACHLALDAAENLFGTTSGNNGGTSTVFEVSDIPTGGTTPLHPTVTGRLPGGPVVAGGKIRPLAQTVHVTNSESNTISGEIAIKLELSSDATGATAGPTVASITRKIRLRAGKSASFPLIVRSLPAGTTGSLFLVAEVTDPSGNTAAGASASAINVETPTVDITGAFVHVPATAKAGHNVTVSLAISEDGNVPVSAALPVELFASADGVLDTNSIDLGTLSRHVSIQPGRKTLLLLREMLPASLPPNSYMLFATLDPNNTLNDANLSNNTFASATTMNVT